MRSTGRNLEKGKGAKPILAAMLMMAALTCASGPLAAAENSTGSYEQALDAAQNNDFTAAAEHLRALLKANPDHLPGRILLGEVLLSLGDAGEAERQLRHALSAGGDPQLIVIALGHADLLQGKTDTLLDDLKITGGTPALQADTSNMRGYAYLERSQLTDAKTAFSKASDLAPGDATAWVGLARAALVENDLPTAANFAEKAFKAQKNGAVWRLRGDIAAQGGRDAEAIAAYGHAVDLAWGDILARTARASLLIGQGRLDEAAADLKIVRHFIPWDPEAVYLDALILAHQNRMADAKILLGNCERALQRIRPEVLQDDRTMLRMVGLIYYALGNFSRAAYYFDQLVSLSPSDPSALRLLARARIETGEYATAIDELRTALTIDDMAPQTHNLLGTVYLLRREYDMAAEQLSLARAPGQSQPAAPGADLRLGIAQLHSGHTEDALQTFTRARREHQDNLPSTLLLAIGSLQAGDFNAAAELGEQAVSLAPDSAYARHIAALAYINAGRSDDAEKQLSAALRLDDRFVPALLESARLAMQKGDSKAARKFYEKALTIDRSNAPAMLELADIARLEDRPASAEKWLQTARDNNPEDTAVWARSMQSAVAQDRLDDAVALGRDFIKRNPNNLFIRNLLAMELWRGNRTADAATEYENMLDVSLDRAGILYRIGLIHEQAGQLQDAIKAYRRALAWLPDNEILWSKVILLEAQTGDQKEALHMLGDYKARKTHPNTTILTAKIYLASHSYDKSLAAFKAAQANGPDSADVAIGIFNALQGLGRQQEALASLATWVKTHTDDRARATLALAYAGADRLADAVSLEEETLKSNPTSVPTLNNLALLSLRQGDIKTARQYADKARKLAPEHPAVLDTLGWIMVNDNAAGDGLAVLRNAQARAGDDPRLHYHMAVALDHLGRKEEALAELRQALAGRDFAERTDATALMSRLRGN